MAIENTILLRWPGAQAAHLPLLRAANVETLVLPQGNAEFSEAVEHSAKRHAADREAGFRRHADQPRQPIFRHSLFSKHVPSMDKDRGVELLGRSPDDIE